MRRDENDGMDDKCHHLGQEGEGGGGCCKLLQAYRSNEDRRRMGLKLLLGSVGKKKGIKTCDLLPNSRSIFQACGATRVRQT